MDAMAVGGSIRPVRVSSEARVEARKPSELLYGRFEPRGLLGEGAFGCVLRAYDRVLDGEVALKELTRMGAQTILRFKNEFRALADVNHTNLVRLHELFEQAGRWAFSMELVDGPDFLSFVRGEDGKTCDHARLRSALAQLGEGLAQLHALGLTHRDVKPSNVRVTREGRVVLLDFGLVTPSDEAGVNPGLGTPAYMAPEQARAGRVDAAADYYGLGVMLYEALTGMVPFQGDVLQLMLAKEAQRPVPPSALVAGVPPDLDALCLGLLERSPERRAGREQLHSVLGVSARGERGELERTERTSLFVGRESELARGLACHRRTLHEGFQVLLIEGESGIGKSSLSRQLADVLANDHGVTVLSGRCHAAEQLPFKLFDGVVDELSKRLAQLNAGPGTGPSDVLPEQAIALATLFPVLAQVARARRSSESAGFQRLERAQIFALFAELLSRVSARAPYLLRVDDLQWADEESMALLEALLTARSMMRVLMVITTRQLDTLEGPLAELVQNLAGHPRVERLCLEPLDSAQAGELSARCIGTHPQDPRAQRVAREAKGHPLFIAELARQVSAPAGESAPASLDDALRRRLELLEPTARRALDLLAVSSAPLPLAVLKVALKVQAEELTRAVRELRTQRWARSARRGDLTCYHDRLREVALSELEIAQIREHHRQLAQAFRAQRDSDPAEVARHLLGAGEIRAAAPWLERAAENALEQQAFERAVALYRDLFRSGRDTLDAARAHQARLSWSDALAAAGRSGEAAVVLLEELELASPEERVAREGRAARHLLRTGKSREGVMTARDALLGVGLSWAGSESSALLRLLWHRADLAVTGIRPVPRQHVPPQRTAQLDALWGLWQPLTWADMLRSAELGARHCRLALRSGDARHLGLALCAEALLQALSDPASPEPARLLERAELAGKSVEEPDLAAFHAFATGTVGLFQSDLTLADRKLSEAELRYARDCPGEAWQLVNVRGALLNLWMNRGDFALGAERAESWLLDARARGDTFGIATYAVTGYGALRWAMQDDIPSALAEVDAAMGPWESPHFGLQHFGAAALRHVLHSYGKSEQPYAYWQRTWPGVKRSFLARAGFVRDIASAMRGEATLRAAVAERAGTRQRLLSEARAILAALKHSPNRLAQACYESLGAQVELLDGRRAQALEMARRAAGLWSVVGNLSSHPCRVLLAHLEETDERASDTTEQVLAWFGAGGWKEPRRALELWLPSLPFLEGR